MLLVPPADRDGLKQLFARYAWTLDTGDVEGLLGCFTEDGEMVQASREPPRHFMGHQGIRSFTDELFGWSRFRGRQHHLSNLLCIDGEAGKCWELRSYVVVSEYSRPSTTFEFIGFYDDLCVAGRHGWRFARRRYSLWNGRLTDAIPQPSWEVEMDDVGGLLERQAIEDLISLSAWALDTGDAAAYAGCFTPEGSVTVHELAGEGEWLGSNGLADHVRAQRSASELTNTQHHIGQYLHREGAAETEDSHSVLSYVFVTRCEPEPPHSLAWAGFFDDVVARQSDGTWKLQSRAVKPWAGDVLTGFSSAAR